MVDERGGPALVGWGSPRIGPPTLDVTLAAGELVVAAEQEVDERGTLLEIG